MNEKQALTVKIIGMSVLALIILCINISVVALVVWVIVNILKMMGVL